MTTSNPLSDDDCKIFTVGSQQYCYIPITKVASTFLRRALPSRSFNIHTWNWFDTQGELPNPDTLRYLVVLRDPLQRWISGAVEFWSRAQPTGDWNTLNEHDILFQQIEFDVHTQPQCDFLQNIDPTRTTWLWCDNNIENHPWFKLNGIQLNPIAEQDRNWGNSRPQIYFHNNQRFNQETPGAVASTPSAVIQRNLTGVLNSSALCQERIRAFYQQDYDLIDSVEFS